MKGKSPKPWMFAITGMPYGVGGSFTGQLMPSFAEHAGIDLGNIGLFTTLLFVPTFLQFLYAPIVDIGPQRRTWLVIVATLGALCLGTACLIPLPSGLTPFLILAFMGQLLSGLVGSCNGGLMATLFSDEQRGKVGFYYNLGNLSGGAIAAAIILLLTDLAVDPIWVGLVLVVLMIGPSLFALTITEPRRKTAQELVDEALAKAPENERAAFQKLTTQLRPSFEAVGIEPFAKRSAFLTMLREVKGVILSRSGITGILLCLSPVGTAALANSFTGMTGGFGAHGKIVAIVNGPANAILSALGAWGGGILCDRYNRRSMYLLSGALTAVVGIGMALGPATPATYTVGVCTYYLVTGFCYSAFTATVLETIGGDDRAASTKYTLFTAAGNVAIAYVGLVATRFEIRHDYKFPPFGWTHISRDLTNVMYSDALLNLGGVLVLGLVFWRLGAFGARRHPKRAM